MPELLYNVSDCALFCDFLDALEIMFAAQQLRKEAN